MPFCSNPYIHENSQLFFSWVDIFDWILWFLNHNKFCFCFSTVIAPPSGHFLKHPDVIVTCMRMKCSQFCILYCNMLRALAAPGSRARAMHFDRTAETVKTGIRNYFSSRDISSFRLNSLGPLCLWQCFLGMRINSC